MSQKTKSENLFEKFCDLNQIPWEKIEESSLAKRPDYQVEFFGQDFIVEIKQFDPNKEERDLIRRQQQGENIAFSINPGERIRKAIRSANSQLRQLSKGTIPTLLVVYDNVTSAPWWDHTSEYSMMTAMKGVDQIPIKVPRDPKKSVIFGELESGGKRAMRSDANTTVSAVAEIRPYADDDIHFRVYHNWFASVPIDPALLRISNIKQFRLPEVSRNSLDKSWELL
ncbi:MAG: hypothetical protein WCD18_04890 [Thermosynechococcaceae cyanobacterium]